MLQDLANTLSLKGVLDGLRAYHWEHVSEWQQGEFHHDVVIRLREPPPELPGDVLVVSTNCNGGVKEISCLAEVPERWGLWHHRCPDNPEFAGAAPSILQSVRTVHWFDPCALLKPGTRSEYRPEFRRRQRGGGYVSIDSDEE
ncbi:MAG: hypothetical protein KDI71_11815 [Xanthomonadales bacterium]|nr:hypothetical protein [Xanthomonadales bacterium]